MIINIFGEIGWDVTAKNVMEQIQSTDDDKIKVVIASGGGSAFEGLMIYDALKASGKEIETVIMGLGASAASVIFMAGDKREMGEGALLMVHNSWSIFVGNADDVREQLGTLEAIDERMTSIFVNGTGLSEERVRELLADETWLNVDEANELGFATGEAQSMDIAASVNNLYKKRKEPVNMAEEKQEVEVTEEEKGLFAKFMSWLKSEPKAESEEKAEDEEKKEEMAEDKEEAERAESEELAAEEKAEEKAEDEKEEEMSEEAKALQEENKSLKAELEALKAKASESDEKAKVIMSAVNDCKITGHEANELAEKELEDVKAFCDKRAVNATGFAKPEIEPEVDANTPEDFYNTWKGMLNEGKLQEAQNYYKANKAEIRKHKES